MTDTRDRDAEVEAAVERLLAERQEQGIVGSSEAQKEALARILASVSPREPQSPEPRDEFEAWDTLRSDHE